MYMTPTETQRLISRVMLVVQISPSTPNTLCGRGSIKGRCCVISNFIKQLYAGASTMAEEQFNQDELVPPSFMTETYIVDILRQVEDDPDLHVKL